MKNSRIRYTYQRGLIKIDKAERRLERPPNIGSIESQCRSYVTRTASEVKWSACSAWLDALNFNRFCETKLFTIGTYIAFEELFGIERHW